MRDVHLRLVVHVDSHPLVGTVLICHCCRQQLLLVMNRLDLWLEFVVESLLLPLEGVDPCLLRLLIVGQNVEGPVTEILFS